MIPIYPPELRSRGVLKETNTDSNDLNKPIFLKYITRTSEICFFFTLYQLSLFASRVMQTTVSLLNLHYYESISYSVFNHVCCIQFTFRQFFYNVVFLSRKLNERKSEQGHTPHAPTLFDNAVHNEWQCHT